MEASMPSFPGVFRRSLKELSDVAREARDAGIPAILLFPVNESSVKTEDGCEAYNPNNLVCQAITQLRRDVPDIGIWADVALDPYTTHGHDGVITNGRVDNDVTLESLAKQAVVLADAGAHAIAPSDMMDGNVQTLRTALDAKNYQDVLIISYPAKFASSFYKPFRHALASASLTHLPNKLTYQIDPRDQQQFYNEVNMDLAEGADMIIVKPGLPYLDVIARVCDRITAPVLAYQVSGEYAMLQTCGLPLREALLETLYAFKRAGATGIITYGALEACQFLRN